MKSGRSSGRNSQASLEAFRQECSRKGLAVTHQRVVIYQTLMGLHHHPSPEEIYERVRREVPSISLGTVYKNLKTFIEHGLLREVSLHHGSSRIEVNLKPHHHLVCLRCKAILDLDDQDLQPVRLKSRAPGGFRVQRYSVEVLGLCRDCGKADSRSPVPVQREMEKAFPR